MNEEAIDMEAMESVIDDYYNEDDAAAEMEYEPWDYEEDEPWDDEEDSAERRSRRWYSNRAERRRRRARRLALKGARGRARPRPSRQRRRRYLQPRSTRGNAKTSQVRKGFNRVSDDVARTKQKIAKVDLEAKVKADALREAVKKQSKRIGGNEYAISATKAIDEITAQFPSIKENTILKSLVPLVPLAFLKPPKKGTGFESLIKDPRVIGAGVAGVVALYRGLNPEKKQNPTSLRVGPAPQLTLGRGQVLSLTAQVLDQDNSLISGESATWQSLDDAIVMVDSATGNITTQNVTGEVTLIARSRTDPNLTASILIRVP